MKKILLSILTLVFALCPILSMNQVAYAKGAALTAETTEIESAAYDFLEDFVKGENVDTLQYDERQAARATYLVNKITEIDNEKGILVPDTKQVVRYSNPYHNDAIEQAVNVRVMKKASVETDKFIVVGANYDNFDGLTSEVLNSDGTTANAVGVATVLAVMQDLRDVDLSVNVEFVFFGANEAGLQGSAHYVSELEEHNKLKDLLLMINVWGIGAGDYNYLYDDEIHWDHFDYIYDLSEELGLGFKKIPTDKKVFGAIEPFTKLNYTHQALLSDNAPFIGKGLPTISLYSGNYTSRGFVQSDRYGSIRYTSQDTFDKFNDIFNRKGEAKIKMNNAVTLIDELLKKETIQGIMENSISNKPNYRAFTDYEDTMAIVTGVVIGLIILAMIIAYLIIKNRAEKSNDPIKPLYIDIDQFVGPNGTIKGVDDDQPIKKEDPFGLDDNKDNNNKDNNNDKVDPFGL